MRATLPEAWSRLVNEEDELLLELVADRVESLCGYKPDPDTVAGFLKREVGLRPNVAAPRPQPSSPEIPKFRAPQTEARVIPIGFVLSGKHFPARNGCDVLRNVFETLASCDATFLERFAALPKHGRTRRYLAQNPEELYPGRPDLVRDHSIKLNSGWWMGTNLSRVSIERIIKMASEVAHIRFGQDPTVNLGE